VFCRALTGRARYNSRSRARHCNRPLKLVLPQTFIRNWPNESFLADTLTSLVFQMRRESMSFLAEPLLVQFRGIEG
jgi:hypothetical protein